MRERAYRINRTFSIDVDTLKELDRFVDDNKVMVSQFVEEALQEKMEREKNKPKNETTETI